MNSDELKLRTKNFAHRCVKAASSLPENVLGKHIAKQLIRSATSVAANYRAVCVALSLAAFSAKLSFVIEEADESAFWIEYVMEENLIKKNQTAELWKEAHELSNIFVASRNTVRKRNITSKPPNKN